MNPPIRFLKAAALVCTTAALFATAAATSRAQSVPLYTDAPIPSTSTAQNASHFLQTISLGVPGPGTFTLTGFTIGVFYNAGTLSPTPATNQSVALYFYNGVDTSATSADALANATNAAVDSATGQDTGLSAILAAPVNATGGNMTYSFTLPRPVTLTLTGTAVGVEVLLLDNSGSNYSTVIQGRFEAAPPTVGSAPGYVWNDLNDNVFQGSEQTTFGQATGAYVRLGFNGMLVVPEPGTWALVVMGGLGLAAVVVRRRLA